MEEMIVISFKKSKLDDEKNKKEKIYLQFR